MTSRFVRSGLALALAAFVSSLAFAQTIAPPPGPANPDDPMVQELRLPDGDIDTVLSMLEMLTGRIVLRPGQLALGNTNFNLKITTPIRRSEAITAIESVLALNNVGIAPLGERFLVVTQLNATARNAPFMITGSALDHPASGKIATKLFQLDFLRAVEIQGVIQQIANLNIGVQPLAVQNANAILITDSVANLQRVEMLLQQLDRPVSAGMKPKFYTLRNGAKASDVVTKIRTILGSLQQQIGTATTYSADDRTNQIVLLTDERQYGLFDELIEKLDVRADPSTRNDVIYLKHAKAIDLVTVLTKVITGQTQAARQNSQSVRPGQIVGPVQPAAPNVPGTPPGAPVLNASPISAALEGVGPGSAEFSALMTLAPDERSNSVVVSGTADDIRLITQLIDKLDTVLAQVRIEVVIAEVSLDDSHTSGISQLGLQIDGDRLVGINGSAPGITLTGATDGSFASISRLGGPGSLARSLDLTGVLGITTTPRKNNTTVLSVPSITTSHAKPATFISSEKRPITTGTTSTPVAGAGASSGFSTQQQVVQQDIGITLTVTPLIGADGSVQLDIDQDVQDVAGFVKVNGDDQPVISHRQTKSTISARSGDIVVLGGMQRNKDSRTTNRLGPIPFLGDLFGSRTKGVTRTELLFFMRPYVLTNSPLDNAEMIKRIEELPTKQVPQKDEIRKLVDPAYVPPKKSGIFSK